uniref:Uncharacterized protein n=1 Tax=Eptatretus burgeri TaxID=7764 RepID=A0A8C4QDK2_EPTBU
MLTSCCFVSCFVVPIDSSILGLAFPCSCCHPSVSMLLLLLSTCYLLCTVFAVVLDQSPIRTVNVTEKATYFGGKGYYIVLHLEDGVSYPLTNYAVLGKKRYEPSEQSSTNYIIYSALHYLTTLSAS